MGDRTDVDTAAVRAEHLPQHDDGGGGRPVVHCTGCDYEWPCPTQEVCAALDEARRLLAERDEQLATYVDHNLNEPCYCSLCKAVRYAVCWVVRAVGDTDSPDTARIRTCSWLLPDPGGEVVRELCDEVDRLTGLLAKHGDHIEGCALMWDPPGVYSDTGEPMTCSPGCGWAAVRPGGGDPE